MTSYKVCLLGAFSVGKTSLVRRFVESIFSDQYHTTIGVKIAKHSVLVDDKHIQFLIWDIEGKDSFTNINLRYLKGAAGIVLVADGTRPNTFDDLLEINDLIDQDLNNAAKVIMLNKCDLESQWNITGEQHQKLSAISGDLFNSSAKTGENVSEAFQALAKRIIANVETS